jgi:hypothetical protein
MTLPRWGLWRPDMIVEKKLGWSDEFWSSARARRRSSSRMRSPRWPVETPTDRGCQLEPGLVVLQPALSSLGNLEPIAPQLLIGKRPADFPRSRIKCGKVARSRSAKRDLTATRSDRRSAMTGLHRGAVCPVWAWEAESADSGNCPLTLLLAREVAVDVAGPVRAAQTPGIGSRRLRRCHVSRAHQSCICEN